MTSRDLPIRGRGAAENLANRFEKIDYIPEAEDGDDDTTPLRTQFFKDASQSIMSYNQSPDVGFDASINPYRGCEHGCIYCYARPTHEFLGFSAGLDFESKIMVKENAAALLRKTLLSPKWNPQPVGISGVTDAYQPVERQLKITRSCLEVFAEFRNPIIIITKNALVTRDGDILSELARHDAAAVFISVTTLDVGLNRILEPRTSLPEQRLKAIETLASIGIPVGVLVAPVIPGLNEHEMPAILERCAEAGAKHASYILLRMPHAVAPLFEAWLQRHYPQRKGKILNHIRSMRRGRLNDPHFTSRMKGEGTYARHIEALFTTARRRAGFNDGHVPLSTEAFRRPGQTQLTLFD